MRLSEAILLGSANYELGRFKFSGDGKNGKRCAIGMAAGACSVRALRPDIHAQWPWLMDSAKSPCGCKQRLALLGADSKLLTLKPIRNYQDVIAHLSNEHVAVGHWTLEQLADYVRSIEPAEPEEPTKHTFACPVSWCSFSGTQEENEIHQIEEHLEEPWSDVNPGIERFRDQGVKQ